MDINELINYITANKPVLTVFILILWWFERNGRLSSEKRERGLLRELADCPPEKEEEGIAEKVGVISTTLALVAASAVFLVGCGTYGYDMTYTPEKTQPAPPWKATGVLHETSATQTPSIIEVTQSPEWVWDTIGVYTPTIVDMNIRRCSVADDTCPIIGEVRVGEGVQFFAIVRHADSGDVWVCLDSVPQDGELLSQCGRMVAFVLSGKEYATLKFAQPDG
jgi:hypothetical protein